MIVVIILDEDMLTSHVKCHLLLRSHENPNIPIDNVTI